MIPCRLLSNPCPNDDRSHRGPAKDVPQFSDMIDETGHILGAVLVAACEHSGKRVDVDGTNAIPARELFWMISASVRTSPFSNKLKVKGMTLKFVGFAP